MKFYSAVVSSLLPFWLVDHGVLAGPTCNHDEYPPPDTCMAHPSGRRVMEVDTHKPRNLQLAIADEPLMSNFVASSTQSDCLLSCGDFPPLPLGTWFQPPAGDILDNDDDYFFHSYDGSGGVNYLTSTSTEPLCPSVVTFDFTKEGDLVTFSTGAIDRTMEVQVIDSSDNVIMSVPVPSATLPGDVITARTTVVGETVNLTGPSFDQCMAGYKIRFAWNIPESFTGPSDFYLDNVFVSFFDIDNDGIPDSLDKCCLPNYQSTNMFSNFYNPGQPDTGYQAANGCNGFVACSPGIPPKNLGYQDCPQDLLWNGTHCDFKEKVQCTDWCFEGEYPPDVEEGACCGEPGADYQPTTDCLGYIRCLPTGPTMQTMCGTGTLWDVSITGCNLASLVTCNPDDTCMPPMGGGGVDRHLGAEDPANQLRGGAGHL